jgi:hypothetical protein
LVLRLPSASTPHFAGAISPAPTSTSSTPPDEHRERHSGTLIRIVCRECLDHLLITGPRHLAATLHEYLECFNTHNPHRSLRQHPPAGPTPRRPERPSSHCGEIAPAASLSLASGMGPPRCHDLGTTWAWM